MAYSDRTSRLEKMRNDRYADRPPLAIRYRETKRPLLPAQSRAARGLFDWSQQQLADAALVDVVTVRQFEGNVQRNSTSRCDTGASPAGPRKRRRDCRGEWGKPWCQDEGEVSNEGVARTIGLGAPERFEPERSTKQLFRP